MSLLRDVRERESTLELDLAVVLDLYRMLEHYLPGGLVSAEEARERALIRVTWRRLLDFAEEVQRIFTELYQSFHFRRCGAVSAKAVHFCICSESAASVVRFIQRVAASTTVTGQSTVSDVYSCRLRYTPGPCSVFSAQKPCCSVMTSAQLAASFYYCCCCACYCY